MLKNKIIMITLLIIVLSSFSSLTALTDEDYKIINEKHEFNPDSFIFEYNDHNSTTYEGDTGLKGAYVNNSLDNYTYFVPVDNVRGIAYATKKSFEFDENIIVTHSLFVENRSYDCIMLEMYYKNGSVIPELDVSDNGLTKEQREYFDDYEQQRDEYYQEQNQYALEDIYDEQSRANSRESQRSHYGYYFGSNGYGVMYNP